MGRVLPLVSPFVNPLLPLVFSTFFLDLPGSLLVAGSMRLSAKLQCKVSIHPVQVFEKHDGSERPEPLVAAPEEKSVRAFRVWDGRELTVPAEK